VPLGRATSPEEICAAARFLIDSPAVTGQMIALDGGQHLAWLLPRQIEGST
jgi:NAD(P)-dependent dehydrogenase (short-subunit alcohol dehydrogenase family)